MYWHGIKCAPNNGTPAQNATLHTVIHQEVWRVLLGSSSSGATPRSHVTDPIWSSQRGLGCPDHPWRRCPYSPQRPARASAVIPGTCEDWVNRLNSDLWVWNFAIHSWNMFDKKGLWQGGPIRLGSQCSCSRFKESGRIGLVVILTGAICGIGAPSNVIASCTAVSKFSCFEYLFLSCTCSGGAKTGSSWAFSSKDVTHATRDSSYRHADATNTAS